MSEYRVGIIAEGVTDVYVIRAILNQCFSEHRFSLILLSPSEEELTLQKKEGGFGWGGVYRTCRELKERLVFASSVGGFDFLIVHLDGDVAEYRYEDAGIHDVENDLPCAVIGDTVSSICEKLERVLFRWVSDVKDAPPIVFCIPYIATETWAGALVFPESWADISEDCDEDLVYARLIALGRPKKEKLRRLMRLNREGSPKKVTSTYNQIGGYITQETWQSVVHQYKQAEKFDV